MSLNIKDEAVHKLASELAQRTGKSMTAVVREALSVYDAHVTEEQVQLRRANALQRLHGCAASPIPSAPAADDFLYDHAGLPA
ncbi:MAG: type II toxin-antitoxin system VapB family antitoxin [Fimbriimonadaceae bacterium]|nr:type II toxin-antitoxin system VapB family antitoxin [Fimbriimonadaceae bacterium]